MSKMISVTQCAKEMKIDPSRVRALIVDGRIKAQKIGNSWAVLDYSKAMHRVNGRPPFRK